MSGFQLRIAGLNFLSVANFIRCMDEMDHSYGPRCDNDSDLHVTVRILLVWKMFSHGYWIVGLVGKTKLKIFGATP